MEWFEQLAGAYLALGAAGMAVVGAAFAAALVGAVLEKGLPSFLGAVALAASLAYFGQGGHPGLSAWRQVADHPWMASAACAGYFAVGLAWSLARFRLYAGSLKGSFREFKRRYLAERGKDSLEALGAPELASFRKEAKVHMGALSRSGSYPAMPADHKGDIFFWMGWWPVSFACWALDKPVKRLMEALYRLFSGVYARIAKDQASEFKAAMGEK